MEDAAEALRRASVDAPLLPRDLRLLAERCMGNPLILEELWRAHRDGAPLDALPDSVDAAVTAQIDALEARHRHVLRCAAVLGDAFTRAELADLLDPELDEAGADGEGAWPERLAALGGFLNAERSGLIRFRSAIVRECAYERLPYRRRRELHGRAGLAMLTRLGPTAEKEAERLSLHFFHAQRYDEAWRYALVAGARARDVFANAEAAALYQRALSAARRLPGLEPSGMADTWQQLGDVKERAGDYRGAGLAYRRARALLGADAVAQAELCLKESRIPERVGRYAEAVRWLRRGLRTLGEETGEEAGRLRAQLAAWYAAVRQAQGHSREAVLWCEQAIELGRRFDDRRAEAHAKFILDWAWSALGRPELATHGEDALAIYEELGDLGRQAVVLNNLGCDAYLRGEWSSCARPLRPGPRRPARHRQRRGRRRRHLQHRRDPGRPGSLSKRGGRS